LPNPPQLNGVIYCWGDNSSGQLGNGTMTSSSVPVLVVNQFPWNGTLSAGSNHTCAVDVEVGFVGILVNKCWGDNSSGQLGNGTTTNSTIPASVNTNAGVQVLTAGTQFSCAVGNPPPYGGFQISCWGSNAVGQLGTGTMTNSAVPVSVSGGLNFVTVSTGAMHACGTVASTTNGTPFSYAYCWGANNSGQLGNGTNANSAAPSLAAGGLSFASVSAGGSHTCGVTSSNPQGPTAGGGVYCWGDNTYGQLGNFSTTSSSVPVNVAGPQ
jgi:alpha-tubulin suppressor-like RCC1 family protein